MHPALTPAKQAGTRFTYPGGVEGWVDVGDLLHTEMVYPTSHPSTNLAQCWLTTLIESSALSTTLCCHPLTTPISCCFVCCNYVIPLYCIVHATPDWWYGWFMQESLCTLIILSLWSMALVQDVTFALETSLSAVSDLLSFLVYLSLSHILQSKFLEVFVGLQGQ